MHLSELVKPVEEVSILPKERSAQFLTRTKVAVMKRQELHELPKQED